MYFKRNRRYNSTNKLIPLLGLGVFILLFGGLYQIIYNEKSEYHTTPKPVRVHFNLEASNLLDNLNLTIGEQQAYLRTTDLKIDSLIHFQMIPTNDYKIRLTANNHEFFSRTISYEGENNLLIDIQIKNNFNSIDLTEENIVLFMDL